MEALAAFAAAGRDQTANAASGADASSSSGYSSDGSADNSWEPDPEDARSAENEDEHGENQGGDEDMDTNIIMIDDDLKYKGEWWRAKAVYYDGASCAQGDGYSAALSWHVSTGAVSLLSSTRRACLGKSK
ncbi:hypothetical protein PR003_g7889 [Phytophthora rubi]|uniref:Uncharacterized protein n=1 Tax=Phytophthora rubi TaxID=129364 RepID=A0A6A3NYF2_9STRA|nr:hypothetical protein PR002_g1891 [Phytophthora rubi]KAE9051058.1 hypothetical protein PR001_g1804 [Phytophthora rubi]KAE9345557.1 hypothetical protein PR003_g7889 [Phytophthora rubi]